MAHDFLQSFYDFSDLCDLWYFFLFLHMVDLIACRLFSFDEFSVFFTFDFGPPLQWAVRLRFSFSLTSIAKMCKKLEKT